MEQANAIELKNITKRFGEVVANDSVDLSVKHGEILSVLGENGSGKTTLMNMISGIYFPDEGQIFVDGEEVSICSPKDSFALGIGMIHQHFKLIDVFSAVENIALGLEKKEKFEEEHEEQIVKIAEKKENIRLGAEVRKIEGRMEIERLKEQYRNMLEEKINGHNRLMKAFPKMTSDNHNETLQRLKTYIEKRGKSDDKRS